MARDRYKISLRLKARTMKAADFCAALPWKPDRCWTAGTPRKSPNGDLLGGLHAETYWTFRLREGEGDLAPAIAETAEQVAPFAGLFHAVRSDGGSAEFFVGLFLANGNSGEDFEPELLARLASLGIRLSLDIYLLEP